MDLVAWAARWLRTASLNTISASHESAEGWITGMRLRQSAPEGHPVLRPHHLSVAMIDGSGAQTVLPAVIDDLTADVPEAQGLAVPSFVFPNHGDHGYVKVDLDQATVDYARERLATIQEPLESASSKGRAMSVSQSARAVLVNKSTIPTADRAGPRRCRTRRIR